MERGSALEGGYDSLPLSFPLSPPFSLPLSLPLSDVDVDVAVMLPLFGLLTPIDSKEYDR